MVKKPFLETSTTPPYGVALALSEIIKGNYRLDAAAYSLEAREARLQLKSTPFPLSPLIAASPREQGLCISGTNGNRFSRTYVTSKFGIPFLSSSDIISIKPERDSYISRKLTKGLSELMIQPWDVLMSRSGTIGNVSLAPPSWSEFAVSEDVIRLQAKDADTAGFAACFLRSQWGRPQVIGHSYGSVITHIETHHLPQILVPNLSSIHKTEIGRDFVEAAQERDQANQQLAIAEQELISRLKLPSPISESKGPVVSQVRASELSGRLDAAYHNPSVHTLESALRNAKYPVKRIDDKDLRLQVRQVTKFRKEST